MKMVSWILLAGSLVSVAHSAIAQDPLDRALILYERRDYEGAFQEANRVIQKTPNYFRAYTLRGQIKKERNDFDGAMADFNFYRAQARERKQELESAADDYGKAIELNPQSAEAYAGRGIVRLSQKNDAEAQADFDQSLKLNPGMKESLNRKIEYIKYHRDKK